jgi:hypothetical protein
MPRPTGRAFAGAECIINAPLLVLKNKSKQGTQINYVACFVTGMPGD